MTATPAVLVADIESDGLLDTITTIHSIVVEDFDTGIVYSCSNRPDYEAKGADHNLPLEDGLEMLRKAKKIVFHNGINYDLPAIAKVHPGWKPEGEVHDTLVMTRLIWSNIRDSDPVRIRKRRLPRPLFGSHSLEAWGYRLGEWKGDYAEDRAKELIEKHERLGLDKPTDEEISAYQWGEWRPEMQDYCVQDVKVTSELYRRALAKNYSPTALKLEHDAAFVCSQIERNGFPFDEAQAVVLYGELSGMRAELEQELVKTFGTWAESEGEVTPRSRNKTQGIGGTDIVLDPEGNEVPNPEDHLTAKGSIKASSRREGYVKRFKGHPYTRVKFTTFNPGSRKQIAERLKVLRGWEPQEFTPSGDAKIDEEVLKNIPYPEAALLSRYFFVRKLLGQLAEGDQAWLKRAKNGKVHGSYNPNGAVTGRASHSRPNITQVPKVLTRDDPEDDRKKIILKGLEGEYGWECRSLYGVPEGWHQVGTDMSGLELRCLAHYMARWDGGEYGRIVLEEDIHTVNQQAAGLPTRDDAKTFIYAFLYGAGDGKLGSITGKGRAHGKRLRANFMARIPAMGKLTKAVQARATKTGILRGLDGRNLYVRSAHSSLNTLLQSAGALLCKKWMTLMDQKLQDMGLKHGWDGDYAFLAWCHDELQIAARTEELANKIGKLSNECAGEAGEFFNFRIKLEADYLIGKTWAETH